MRYDLLVPLVTQDEQFVADPLHYTHKDEHTVQFLLLFVRKLPSGHGLKQV